MLFSWFTHMWAWMGWEAHKLQEVDSALEPREETGPDVTLPLAQQGRFWTTDL